jgi:hypothetical protein
VEKYVWFLLLFLLLQPSFNLFSQTAQNGDVYVLIGDVIKNTSLRGVWALNNNTTKIPGKLYSVPPKQVSGIKATPYGEIYTFKIDEQPNKTPSQIKIRINWYNGNPFWGWHSKTHAWHTGFATNLYDHYGHRDPTKETKITKAVPTSKPSNYIPYGWDKNGDGKPDSGAPSCNSNWYLVPNGSTYHSFIVAKNTWGTDYPADRELDGKSSNPRYIIKESQTWDLTDWYLYKWTSGTGNVNKGSVASSKEITISRQYKNGCHDGCTGGTSGATIKGSSYVNYIAVNVYGDVYFYKRNKGTGNYSITFNKGALPSGSKVIGDPQHCKYFALSTKGNHTDWVYCLNDTVIKNWLKEAGYSTGGVSIDGVAVSDQWWRDGGIIFAYNKAAGVVYMIERNENAPAGWSKIINTNQIPVGSDVDSISSDGFGNLYYARTYYDPPSPSQLKMKFVSNGGNIVTVYWHQEPNGDWMGDVILQQKVRKEVFRYGYYSHKVESMGAIEMGYLWYHCIAYAKTADKNNPSKWFNVSQPQLLSNYDAKTVSRLEITAVNYATPPQVQGHIPGKIDIAGPYSLDNTDPQNPKINKETAFFSKTYTETNKPAFYTSSYQVNGKTYYKVEGIKDNTLHLFMVENYPVPSIMDYKTNPIGDRAVNTRSGDGIPPTGLDDTSQNTLVGKAKYSLKTQNGKSLEVNKRWSGNSIGGFVSTLDYSYYDNPSTPKINEGDRDNDGVKDSPKFIWYLYQKMDKYGNIFDQGGGKGKELFHIKTDSPMFGVMLEGGVYDLFVTSDYSWFDYTKLGKTDSAADRWTKPGVWIKHEKPTNAQAISGAGKYYPTYGNYGNVNWAHYRFLVVPTPPPPPDGQVVCVSGPATEVSINGKKRYVVDEDQVLLWELKNGTASPDKINQMMQSTPPQPAVSNYENLEWTTPVQTTITCDLKDKNGKGIVSYTSSKSSTSIKGPATVNDFRIYTGKDDPTTTSNDESQLLSIPSEPECYTIRISSKRQYHYWTVIDTQFKDEVSGQIIKLQQKVEFPNIIVCEGETKVMVRDTYSPGDDTVLDKVVIMDSAGNQYDINGSMVKYFMTTGDNLVWDVKPKDFGKKVDPVLPGDLKKLNIVNPSVIKLYFKDDNPFGNEDPSSAEIPTLSQQYGYLRKTNPTVKNPSYTTFFKQDQKDGWVHKHEQNFYARFDYETYFGGLTDKIFDEWNISSVHDFITKCSTSYFNSNSKSGLKWADFKYSHYIQLDKKIEFMMDGTVVEKNIAAIKKYRLPKNDKVAPSMEDEYFADGFASGNIMITPDDAYDPSKKDPAYSYFSVTLKMKKLFKYFTFSYEANPDVPEWTASAPNVRTADPLDFGLVVSDGSGNRERVSLGELKIRDNDPPNIFMKVSLVSIDNKKIEETLPTNIIPTTYWQSYSKGGYPIYTKYNKGDWLFENEAKKDYNLKLYGLGDSPYGATYFPVLNSGVKVSLRGSHPFMEKKRVKIGFYASDNATNPLGITYTANLSLGNSSYSWTTNKTLPTGITYHYVVFPQPSKEGYTISGKVEDRAMNWEGQYTDGTGKKFCNGRKFEFKIGPVLKTDINVHILSETRQ